jgi:hypothetical protein
MARFRCMACNRSGKCQYHHRGHGCPLCGSPEVVFTVATDELPDEVLVAFGPVPPAGDDGVTE